MKTAEKIFVIMFYLALFIRHFYHLGTATMLSCSCFGLSILYFLFSFALLNNIRFTKFFSAESYKDVNWKKILFAVGAGIILSIGVFGIISCRLSWPGHIVLAFVGTILNLLLVITSAIMFKRYKSELHRHILIRAVPMCGLLLLIW